MISFRTRTVAGLATALTLAAAPIALAGQASAAPASSGATAAAGTGPDGDIVLYNGGSGVNHLSVSEAPYPKLDNLFYVVFKDRVDIKAGFNCDYPSKANHKVVRCVASIEGSNPDGLLVNLGAGNDTVTSTNLTLGADVRGGAGNDRITGKAWTASYGDDGNDSISGGPEGEFLYGGRGNDHINGNDGKDTIYGNSGNDVLNGGKNNDTISGGPGRDKIDGGPGQNKITP